MNNIIPSNTDGKILVLIGWAKDEHGEDDVALFTGIARWDGNHLRLDRGKDRNDFDIPDEWLIRLKCVDDDVREILLGADYSISFSVGDLSDDENEIVSTGLKWPS